MSENSSVHLTSNELEAANRAEATALLIRAGYRVYRPEADCYGEDLVIRAPNGELRAVQLKGRPTVNNIKYSANDIWMLFPDPKKRDWFLVPHKVLYPWVKQKHQHTPKWQEIWSYPTVSRELRTFLEPYCHTSW